MGKRPRAAIPQEYAADVVLPLVRGAVANLLSREGYSQHGIGRVLGISQPMVHKYLSHGLEYYLSMLEAEGVPRGRAEVLLEAACDAVREGDLTTLAVTVNTITLYTNYCTGQPGLCRSTLCTDRDPRALYRRVLSRLLRVPGIQRLIPEVGSNLAYAPEDANSIEDVVGLEGRIVKASTGRVLPAGDPVPGGSRHVGRVALELRSRVGGEAWAFALRGSREIVEAARRAGVSLGHDVGDGVVGMLESGEGVEPVLYLVSGDPWELVAVVRRIAEIVSNW